MAVFEAKGTGTTGANSYTLRLTVSEIDYSIPNNTSTVSWKLQLISTGYNFALYGFPITANVDGEVYNVREQRSISKYSTLTIDSGTKIIPHGTDGKKTISCSATVRATGDYYLPGNIDVSGSLKLTDIPRTSPVSCTSFNIGSSCVITISKADSSLTHTLTYSFGNATGTIATKDSRSSIPYTFNAATLYAQIPNAKSGTGTITCKTYSGNTEIGTSTCPFTASAVEDDCKPTVSLSVIDSNSTTTALTGNNQKLIKGYSTASVTITATPKNSATISSRKITTSDNRSSTSTTATFANITGNVFNGTATDSRGYTGNAIPVTKSGSNWIDYVKLAFSTLDLKRTESTGDSVVLTIKGNYFNASFGAVANTLTVQYRYKTSGGSYGSWVTPTVTKSGNTFSYSTTLTLSHDSEYVFQFKAADKLVSLTSQDVVLTKGIPIIRVGKDYVKVNGNKVVTENLVSKTLNSAAWYRVACLSTPSSAYGGNFIVSIGTVYSNNSNTASILSINITYNKAKITQLSGLVNANSVTQARVVQDSDGKIYLEIYYSIATSNQVTIAILNGHKYFGGMLNFTSPAGQTVLSTCVLSNNQFDSIRIPANSDLNNYTNVGFYYNNQNVDVRTMSNVPEAKAFSLLVERHAGVKQTFTTFTAAEPHIYVRNYYNGTWGDWNPVINYISLGTIDLNTIEFTGFYYVNRASIEDHAPIAENGYLTVNRPSANYQIQTYVTYATQKTYQRIKRNGTWDAWHRIYSILTLYSNSSGTTGTVTLSESAANFDYIEIFAHRSTRYFSQKIAAPNGKTVSLTHSFYNTDSLLYIYSQTNTISGTSITRGTEAYFISDGTTRSGATNTYIDKVVGYR
mgnify:CR=1 FL=1